MREKRAIVQLSVRWLLAIVMMTAGVGKLLGEHGSVLAVVFRDEPALARAMFATFERAVAPMEVITAVGLLVSRTLKAACAAGLLLSLGFLWIAASLPDGVECDCFGVLGGFRSRAAHLATATVVCACFLLAGWGVKSRSNRATTDAPGTHFHSGTS